MITRPPPDPAQSGDQAPLSAVATPLSACPRCGAPVVYGGRGRRPVWCSTRCRNLAADARRGARESATEIRIVEIPRPSRRVSKPPTEQPAPPATQIGDPQPLAAARIVLRDPAAVAHVVRSLNRAHEAGWLDSRQEWHQVREEVLALAGRLTGTDGPADRAGNSPPP